MAIITLRGNEVQTNGELLVVDSDASLFTLIGSDLGLDWGSTYFTSQVTSKLITV